MVLIGMRFDEEDNQFYFLLQNWWEHCYFVEVSGDYMSAVGCVITFVSDPIIEIPEDLPRLSTESQQTFSDVQEWIVEMTSPV